MSQIISLTVHGRSYQITSDEGKESHLVKLAQHIDRKMAELEATVGQIGEQRLLFMSALVIADELFGAQRQVDGLKSRSAERRGGHEGVSTFYSRWSPDH